MKTTTTLDVNRLDPAQWGLILALLSMDVIVPFYEEMGLILKNKRNFVPVLRDLILTNRKQYEADQGVVPPIAEKVLAALQSTFGESDAQTFFRWATNIFFQVHADNPQWSAWEILMSEWVYNHSVVLSRLSENRAENPVDRYGEINDIADVESKIAVVRQKPLSVWDMEMYAIHGFSNDDELNDPFADVVSTIEMNRFRRFWRMLCDTLTSEDKRLLHEQGQKTADELEIWMPGPLVDPDALWRQDAQYST